MSYNTNVVNYKKVSLLIMCCTNTYRHIAKLMAYVVQSRGDHSDQTTHGALIFFTLRDIFL